MKKLKPFPSACVAVLLLLLPALGRTAMTLEDEIRETAEEDPRALWQYDNALYAQHMGDVERSLEEFHQAPRSDSKSSIILYRLAYTYYPVCLEYHIRLRQQ